MYVVLITQRLTEEEGDHDSTERDKMYFSAMSSLYRYQ